MIECITEKDGTKYWYTNGVLHREDGPTVEWSNGSKWWFKNGLYHREDGPAVEDSDGYKAWYIHGYKHREDGPAIEWLESERKEYWINDVQMTEVEYFVKFGVANE